MAKELRRALALPVPKCWKSRVAAAEECAIADVRESATGSPSLRLHPVMGLTLLWPQGSKVCPSLEPALRPWTLLGFSTLTNRGLLCHVLGQS